MALLAHLLKSSAADIISAVARLFYIKRVPFLRLCGHKNRFDISSLDPCKLAGASDTPVLVSPRSIDITHISSHDAYSCARGYVIGITSF